MIVMLCGITLPLVALVWEALGHPCADMWFDPIPTGGHMLLIATVPLVSTLYLIGHRSRALDVLTGVATTTTICYSLAFLPYVPVSVWCIPILGIGLLPLSPLLALFSLHISARAVSEPRQYWLGFGLGFLALGVFWLPPTLTRAWIDEDAVGWLRALGHDATMRKDCGAAQYFRITGRVLGDEEPVRGLRQTSSRMVGKADPGAALAYLEWTFDVQNDTGEVQEAMVEVGLPAGSVVSRATLWIDGTEREAAYTSAEKATRAYGSLVLHHLDPLLVTCSGPGRVQVRCYPVPPGGKRTFKLGVTIPMTMIARGEAWLETPRVLRANFAASRSAELNLDGRVSIARLPATICFARDSKVLTAWAPLHREGFAVERLQSRPAPERIALVVDTSAGMRGHAGEVDEAIEALQPDRIFYATDDGWSEKLPDYAGGRDNLPALKQALEGYSTVIWLHARQPYAGPQLTNVQALLKGGRDLIEASLEPGGDAVLQELQLPAVRPLARRATLAQDVVALRQPRLEFELRREERIPKGHAASDHLARLWALQAGKALEYKLVTPETGAVVLETMQQYAQNDLIPATPDEVPSVPEPGTMALVAVALAAAGVARKRCA